MPNVMMRNIPERDHAELQQDAKQNRRSINAEIMSLLADKADMNRRRRRMKKPLASSTAFPRRSQRSIP
jgi:plasmid stability protein